MERLCVTAPVNAAPTVGDVGTKPGAHREPERHGIAHHSTEGCSNLEAGDEDTCGNGEGVCEDAEEEGADNGNVGQ